MIPDELYEINNFLSLFILRYHMTTPKILATKKGSTRNYNGNVHLLHVHRIHRKMYKSRFCCNKEWFGWMSIPWKQFWVMKMYFLSYFISRFSIVCTQHFLGFFLVLYLIKCQWSISMFPWQQHFLHSTLLQNLKLCPKISFSEKIQNCQI